MDKLSSIGPAALRRRQVLKLAAGGAGLAFASRFGGAFAQDKPFTGQSLNVLIIQPHVVTGDKLAVDFEAATGAKVNVFGNTTRLVPVAPSDLNQKVSPAGASAM